VRIVLNDMKRLYMYITYIIVTSSPIHTNTLIYKNKMRLRTGDEQVTFSGKGDETSPQGVLS
jgi:hypothetical protein